MNTLDPESTRKMQTIILGILTAIDEVCKKHHLRYYLIAGTQLGAVRHKGFIPWDDDADVALPRKDYDQLVAHANEWLPEEYELVSGDKDPHYPYQFARIQNKETTYILRRCFDYVGGIPVDVFPLDGMTSHPIKRRIHYFKYNFIKRLMYFALVDPYKHGKGMRSLFILLCHKCFSLKWLHSTLDSIQKEYDFETSSLVADHDNDPSRGILPKEVYGTPLPTLFEGKELQGVQAPDAYLRYCYGDYMQLPKVMPPINFRYLDMDTPYRDYLERRESDSRSAY